eukprot:g58406.t1
MARPASSQNAQVYVALVDLAPPFFIGSRDGFSMETGWGRHLLFEQQMKCGGKCTVLIRRAMPKKLSAGAISIFSWCLVHQLLVRCPSKSQPFESHP